MVAAARRAATLDSLERALSTGAFASGILVADSRDGLTDLPSGVVVDLDAGAFHFGRRLAWVIDRYGLEKPLYFSGGSLPLLAAQEFVGIAHELGRQDSVVITNNLYSADLVAFSPGKALKKIKPPDSDNPLARLLAEQAGLSPRPLPRSVSSQFDIDSPSDLAILTLVGGAGPRLERLLDRWRLDVASYRRALAHFTDPTAQVLVAGRTGSQVWQYLEGETACRVRFFAEERGMQAEGRLQNGRARSLLGFYLAEVGVERFFATLAELADAAFLDTRVLLAHLGVEASRADRFLSDIGQHEAIEEPFLRGFTEAAGRAPIPVMLGGHSLVSGGLMALVEYAWQEHDRGLGLEGRADVDAGPPLD
jgi:2-phospho-L-lactate guanylyltransferase (CobY/MobA/RfbA family)